jgi:hypothetical protein
VSKFCCLCSCPPGSSRRQIIEVRPGNAIHSGPASAGRSFLAGERRSADVIGAALGRAGFAFFAGDRVERFLPLRFESFLDIRTFTLTKCKLRNSTIAWTRPFPSNGL